MISDENAVIFIVTMHKRAGSLPPVLNKYNSKMLFYAWVTGTREGKGALPLLRR